MKGLVGGTLLVGGLGPGPSAPPPKSGPAIQCIHCTLVIQPHCARFEHDRARPVD